RNQRCYNIKECIQTCVESDCSLKCLKSDVCLQNCHGNGCSANCHSNESCLQTCHDKANCTKLICESESCQQNCKNSSYCGLLSCHGKNCRQETFVEKSELVCTSSRCEEQISHASNTILYCNSVDGSCIQKCYGSGCVMTCGQDVKKCQQYCGGGNCNMTCASGVDTCSMECPGGNCTFSCGPKKCGVPHETSNVNVKGNNETKSKALDIDDRPECKNSGNKLSLLFLIFPFKIAVFIS
ncbi:keratin-associated protein 10-4-like, partial [Dendronephthya gigantea]|uniref:keratin-associated protein 10-4-like n=1 Tax=Dendronephthya gigantea TaxID=151771 RepID=UPI00106B328F